MNTGQVQIRVSISQQLGDLLKSKADRLGVPLTQLVKYLIIKEVEDEEYPVFQASEETEIAAAKAIAELPKLKSITNVHDYLKQL